VRKYLLACLIFSLTCVKAQWNDSVVVNEYYLNFNFFRQNNIKRIDHLDYCCYRGRNYWPSREYSLTWNKTWNLIIKKFDGRQRQFFYPARTGEALYLSTDVRDSLSKRGLVYNELNQVARYWEKSYVYDSLGRVKTIIDSLPGKNRQEKHYVYENNRLKKIDIYRFVKDSLTYSSYFEFNYISPLHVVQSSPHYENHLFISRNRKKLTTVCYNDSYIIYKTVDIIKKYLK
jgi:hypothetical protein